LRHERSATLRPGARSRPSGCPRGRRFAHATTLRRRRRGRWAGSRADDGPECLRGAALAPFEGDQHAGVEPEGHAARRRDLFGGSPPARPPPRHSVSMRSTASSSSGGTPYFWRYASAAANFASRDAISARRADTFPLWRQLARALRLLRVAASSEKLVVFVLPARILAV